MPELSLPVGAVVTIVGVLISIGVTWGVMSSRTKVSEAQIHNTIAELKDAVKELKALAVELHVMKAASTRSERDIENHEKRIAALELAIAKLQS